MELRSEYPVVIVGGGPSGISLAIELLEMGLRHEDFVVLEKGEASIKAVRQFYPDKKLTLPNYKNLPVETHGNIPAFETLTKAETIVYFDELLAKYKIPYVLNSEVSKILKVDGGFQIFVNQQEIKAEQVAIGIGILGRPNKPSYKIPLKIRKQVLFDLTTVEVKNEKVLVIGGGDTSSEYCQILVEEGCETTLAYRKDKITRMMPSNLDAVNKLVAENKLKLRLSCDVEGLEEEGGRPKVLFKDSPPEVYDKVIYAIGGSTPVNFLKLIGVEFDEKNWPIYNEAGETNIEGLYLIGDLVAGKSGGSIITAYNASFRSAQKIMSRLPRQNK